MPVGAAGDENTRGKAKTTHVPIASLSRTNNFEEIYTRLAFVMSAALSAPLSRIVMRYAALPVP